MKLKSRMVARRGLTLLELVVVVAILAALAGMVVPRLDFLKAQADAVADANTSADLVTMISTYKTSSGSYPALDTLNTGTALVNLWSDGGNITLPVQSAALGASFMGGLTDYSTSLVEGGLTTFFANSATGSVSSSTLPVATNPLGGTINVAQLIPTTASQNPYAAEIFPSLFPQYTAATTGTTPTPGIAGYNSGGQLVDASGNVRGMVIALGVGSSNGMIGNVMASAPLDTQGDDPTTVYCRYIAIFAVYNDGTPAQLKTVVDHRFKTINYRLQQYTSQSPTKG